MISGMIAATLTPFTAAGRLDPAAIERHVEYLVEGGLPAVAPAGTTGEFLYLSEEERVEAVVATAKAAAGRMQVIAGIWALDVEGVVRLARAAERSGADAVFLTTPIYYPASDEAVLRWYRAARAATGLPLFAYSIPQYAVNDVGTDVLRELIDEGTVQGIKDSTGKAERIQALLDTAAGRIGVYGASDSFALQARRMAATGFISALANIFPGTLVRIWNGAPGEQEAAQAAIDRVRAAVKGYGGLGGLKALLRARGHDFGPTRLPFGNLSAGDEAELHELAEALDGLT